MKILKVFRSEDNKPVYLNPKLISEFVGNNFGGTDIFMNNYNDDESLAVRETPEFIRKAIEKL